MSYEAASRAIGDFKANPAFNAFERLLERKNGFLDEFLYDGPIRLSYYPGSVLDLVVTPERFAQLSNSPDYMGMFSPEKVAEMSREAWVEQLQQSLEMKPKVEAWKRGISLFYHAVQQRADELGVEVPLLDRELLDIWEQDLVGPGRLQEARENDELEKAEFIVETELTEKPWGKVTSMTGVVGPEWTEALLGATQERYKLAETLEPGYARAVDENIQFDDPEECYFLLAGAVLLHDLFALYYEREEFRAIMETP